MEGLYEALAEAYARGMLPATATKANGAELLAQAKAAGLKLHRFKRTMDLPRVRSVLGALRGLAPENLIDFGSGRGVFLWPLLDAFPALAVTAVERDERRLRHLEAVKRGGIERLSVIAGDASVLPLAGAGFDGATVLEVLEHQHDPLPLAREAVRLARRFVIASVPSKPDDNPEHVQLFTGETLQTLLMEAGAARISINYVPGHIIAVARVRGR
jgi:ubiquinone/menaquinone biosynthesis C-methylase UbiE